MSLDTLSQNDKAKISQWMDAGLRVMQEVDDLKEGLKETTKAIAEEYGVKPAIFNEALQAARKSNLQDKRDGLTQVEEILQATGRA